jgi:hypothetical protein
LCNAVGGTLVPKGEHSTVKDSFRAPRTMTVFCA